MRMVDTERLEVEELGSLHQSPRAGVAQVLDAERCGGAELRDDRAVSADDTHATDSRRSMFIYGVTYVNARFLHMAETRTSFFRLSTCDKTTFTHSNTSR